MMEELDCHFDSTRLLGRVWRPQEEPGTRSCHVTVLVAR